METDIVVRTGTPEDIISMMDLALSANEENGLFEPSAPKLLGEIWSSLNLHHGIVGIIGKPGETLQAACLLRAEAMWYSDKMCLIERGIYVAPEFRAAKGGRASKLADFAIEASVKLGMPLVIGVLSNQRTEGKVKLYERKFGKPAGAYWIVNGHTGWKEGEA